MSTVVVNGRVIHLSDTETQGPPVMLLHSSGMSSKQWRSLIRVLGPTHRVIAPDLLGYGRNDPWPVGVPFDYRWDVDVARAVIQYAAEPVHLIGHSYGGLIAMLVVAEGHPAVASIAAFEPVVFGVLRSCDGLDALGPFADRAVADAFFELDDGGLGGWMARFVEWWNGPGSWDFLPESQQQALSRAAHKTYDEVKTLALDETPHTAFQNFEGRATLLTGDRSPPAGQRVCEILAESFPNGHVERFPGVGHMAPIMAARRVNAAIQKHLDASVAGATS